MNKASTHGNYLILDTVLPESHPNDSILQEIPQMLKNEEDYVQKYFNGLEIQVNLLESVKRLLQLICIRLMPILRALVNNRALAEQATKRYIQFLRRDLSSVQKCSTFHNIKQVNPSNVLFTIPEDDVVYTIWICHMIDSWAYYNDCMSLCNGKLIDHNLVSNLEGHRRSFSSRYNDDSNENVGISIQIHDALLWLYRMCCTFSLPHFSDRRFQRHAIQRYYYFLTILRSHPSMFLNIPRPSDIMLVWMAHCLHPRIFRQDVQLLLGQSSKVLLERLEMLPIISYLQGNIQKMWTDMFNCDLLIPGTLHRPLLPHNMLKDYNNFRIIIKKYLSLSVRFTDKTKLHTNEWYIDQMSDSQHLHMIKVGSSFVVSCRNDTFLIRVRHGIWPRIKYSVVGFIDLPFANITTGTIMGKENYISWTGEYFQLTLYERHYGLRPLPPILANFVELPAGHPTNVIVFTSSHDTLGMCIHFLPDVKSVFMFPDENADSPLTVCKIVSSMFLPRNSQLKQSDIFPHMDEESVGLIVHDKDGEQILVITDKDRSKPLKICALNNSRWSDPIIDLPVCNRRMSKTNVNLVGLQFTHKILHSPKFHLLICASISMWLLNLSDQSKAHNLSAASSMSNNVNNQHSVIKSKSVRTIPISAMNHPVGFDF